MAPRGPIEQLIRPHGPRRAHRTATMMAGTIIKAILVHVFRVCLVLSNQNSPRNDAIIENSHYQDLIYERNFATNATNTSGLLRNQ